LSITVEVYQNKKSSNIVQDEELVSCSSAFLVAEFPVSFGVTRITSPVRALTASVAKKSINDALPVISETELIFIMGKQTLLKGRLRAGAEKRSVFKLDS